MQIKFFFVVLFIFLATGCSNSPYQGAYIPTDYCKVAVDFSRLESLQVQKSEGGYIYESGGSTCFLDVRFKRVFTILSGSEAHAAQRKFLGLSQDNKSAYFMEITIDNKKDIKNGFFIKKRILFDDALETEIGQFYTSKEIFGARTWTSEQDMYIEYEIGKVVILDLLLGIVRVTSDHPIPIDDEAGFLEYVQIKDRKFSLPSDPMGREVPKVQFPYDSVNGFLINDKTGIMLEFTRIITSKLLESHLVHMDLTSLKGSFKVVASSQYLSSAGYSDGTPRCLIYYKPKGLTKSRGIIQETCQNLSTDDRKTYDYDEITGVKTELPFREGQILEVRL